MLRFLSTSLRVSIKSSEVEPRGGASGILLGMFCSEELIPDRLPGAYSGSVGVGKSDKGRFVEADILGLSTATGEGDNEGSFSFDADASSSVSASEFSSSCSAWPALAYGICLSRCDDVICR